MNVQLTSLNPKGDVAIPVHGKPTICEVSGHVERARALLPILAERAAKTTKERMVSRDTVRLMREAGLLKLLRPKRFGGDEVDFDIVVNVLETLSLGCAATAWVCGVLTEHSWFVSCFPERAQLDVWGNNHDACAAASFSPRPVKPVDGGYAASGVWSFCSGIDHCDWILLGALGPDGMMFLLVPKTDVEIIDDWYTLGLRGSGSKSVKLSNVFVPSYRTLSYEGLMHGVTPGAAVHPEFYLLRAPQQLLAPYCLPSVILGQAQKALNLFCDSLKGKIQPNGSPLGDQQVLQAEVAKLAAEIEMVRLLMLHQTRKAVAALRAGKIIPVEQSLDGRRDFHVIAHKLVAVVIKVLSMNGSRWVYEGDPLQEILRDVMTASGHRGAWWDGLLGSGSMMLGGSGSDMLKKAG